jgi:positive regulator of sigma E activity
MKEIFTNIIILLAFLFGIILTIYRWESLDFSLLGAFILGSLAMYLFLTSYAKHFADDTELKGGN